MTYINFGELIFMVWEWFFIGFGELCFDVSSMFLLCFVDALACEFKLFRYVFDVFLCFLDLNHKKNV
jgi:hypothetical protein